MTPRSAWARTVVLLAIVLEVPLLARAVCRLTSEPRVESLEIDGVPVELTVPGGRGPWPAFHFVTGAHPERRQEPVVQRVARGLARAGFVVVVPDLPGLGEVSSLLARSTPPVRSPTPYRGGQTSARVASPSRAHPRGRASRLSRPLTRSSRIGSRSSPPSCRSPTSSGSPASPRRRGTSATARPSASR